MGDAPKELWVQLAVGGGTISYKRDPREGGFDNSRPTYHYHLTQPTGGCYSLKEIEALAKEWAIENEATNDARWIVSGLLAWLAKREREGLG